MRPYADHIAKQNGRQPLEVAEEGIHAPGLPHQSHTGGGADYQQTATRPGAIKNPSLLGLGFWGKDPGDDLLLHDRITLPSARLRFTSVFGMGTGGATTL